MSHSQVNHSCGPKLLRTLKWEEFFPVESLVAQPIKNPPAMRESSVRSLGWEDPLENGMTTHSSILAWRILWTAQSMGSQRAGQDWASSFHFTSLHSPLLLFDLAMLVFVEFPMCHAPLVLRLDISYSFWWKCSYLLLLVLYSTYYTLSDFLEFCSKVTFILQTAFPPPLPIPSHSYPHTKV